MVFQMVGNEALHKVVAVVVACVAAQRERLTGLCASCFQQMGVELIRQKFVTQALVYQNAAGEGRTGCLDALRRVGSIRCSGRRTGIRQ